METEAEGKSIITGLTSLEEAMATAWLEDKVTNEEPDAIYAERILRILSALNGVVKNLLGNS